MKNQKSKANKQQAPTTVGSGDLLGSIEFAVITSKNRRTMTLDFLNGHPVKLDLRQAGALCQLIGLSLPAKSDESTSPFLVCVREAGVKAMTGTPQALPCPSVYSSTKPQNETALTSPRKNRQGYNVREYRVGSYKCKCGALPNAHS